MTDQTSIQEFVHALAASPDFARDRLCLAARTSGLYRSDDGGGDWQLVDIQSPIDAPLPCAAAAFSPDFAADHSLFAGAPGAIVRSEDGGHSWQVRPLSSPPPFVSVLAVSPAYDRDGTLFAGTVEDGVFRSADRGMHWAAWNFGLLDLNVLSLAVSPAYADDDTLFVGTDSGIFRSTTGGRAWREVDAGPEGERSTDFAPVLSLALSPGYAADGIVFAGTETNGLYRSTDRGRTWSQVGGGALSGAVNGLVLAAKYPQHPHILALLNDMLLVSRDDGATWIEWQPGWQASAPLTCVVAPLGIDPGASLLVGTAGGEVVRL
jgi:photosystem II stability/assembly factor-like uncharacterized protein